MNKHTPGKWIAESDGEYWNVIVEGGQGFGREIVGCEGLYRCDGSDEANARLIAAAPTLLEALTKKVQDAEQRMFEDWLEFNSPSGDHEAVQRQWLESNDYRGFIGEWREQLDAIAKATGEA